MRNEQGGGEVVTAPVVAVVMLTVVDGAGVVD